MGARETKKLAVIAHHEAGHAVAAFFLRDKFKHVTIVPKDESAGHLLPLRPVRSMEKTHARAIVGLAGIIAQRRYNGRCVREYHSAPDRKMVSSYAFDLAGSQAVAQALLNLWYAQANELIKNRWNAVEDVASALLRDKTLSSDDVRDIILAPAFGSLHAWEKAKATLAALATKIVDDP